MKFWHEEEQEEIDKLVEENATWGYVMENYKQPDWCNYPDALDGKMGCWSLTDVNKHGLRTKISNEFCKDCDCYKKSE